ncbi:hypothetical protein V6N12_029639 [Hibiscus sabdariffa]|uniref:Uncharacterized protein n=1 Tax=Hibiscus sabdariffa TaxID=183260 RepID=A0ABR2CWS4_9ROSI
MLASFAIYGTADAVVGRKFVFDLTGAAVEIAIVDLVEAALQVLGVLETSARPEGFREAASCCSTFPLHIA